MNFHKNLILPVADLLIGTNTYKYYQLIKKLNKKNKNDITKWQN